MQACPRRGGKGAGIWCRCVQMRSQMPRLAIRHTPNHTQTPSAVSPTSSQADHRLVEKFLAEVFGTAVLIVLGDGVVAAVLLAKSKAQNAGWIVITMGWGLAVFSGVVIAGPLSGAHLNPAVTLGLAVMEAMKQGSTGITWATVPPYIAGGFIGATNGATIVAIHYWDHFKATEDPGLKLAVFCTAPAIRNYPLNLFSEIRSEER